MTAVTRQTLVETYKQPQFADEIYDFHYCRLETKIRYRVGREWTTIGPRNPLRPTVVVGEPTTYTISIKYFLFTYLRLGIWHNTRVLFILVY